MKLFRGIVLVVLLFNMYWLWGIFHSTADTMFAGILILLLVAKIVWVYICLGLSFIPFFYNRKYLLWLSVMPLVLFDLYVLSHW